MIAAMIMCHKNLEQVHRLVQALSHEEIDIFVHIDKKCTENHQITRSDSGDIYFVKDRISGYLDNKSLIDITFSMIELAKKNEEKNKHYEYYMLFSGQDYPIRNMSFIVTNLRIAYPTPFIDCNGGDKNNPIIRSKFGKCEKILKLRFYLTHKIKYVPKILVRVGIWFITKILFTLHLSDYYYFKKNNIDLYCGSAWWILPDIIIDFILNEKEQPYVKRLLATDTPEETFFQIMSRRSPLRDLIQVKEQKDKQTSKTWAYFHDIDKPMAKHPYIFTKNEYNKLVESDYWFGRKFDINVDSEIMDMLDNYRKTDNINQ